jgi:hypothetical protein
MKNLFLTAVATVGLTAATIAQVPSYVPTNGLVGWWPFNGNANDESGNGNNGTVNGATLTNDRFGNVNKAYSFDGVDDFIDVGNSANLNFSDALSISVWLKKETTNGNVKIIEQCDLVNFWANYQFVVMSDGKIAVGLRESNTTTKYTYSANSVQNNSWYHVVFCWSTTSTNGFCKIFINGVEVGYTTQEIKSTNLYVVSPESTKVGADIHAPIEAFKGKLDDIAIYNRAFTQQEITALYNGCQLAVNTQPVSQTININNTAQFTVGSSDPNTSYQWQTDFGVGYQNVTGVGQYIGATTNTLTVSNVTMSNNNQPFRCIVSSGTCSDTSDVAVLTVNNNASIDALSNDKLFTVYPNPAQNQLHVKTGIELMNASYSIIDNTGRTVLTGQLTSESTVIELSGLSIGTYFLNVGDQLKESFKVLKNQ